MVFEVYDEDRMSVTGWIISMWKSSMSEIGTSANGDWNCSIIWLIEIVSKAVSSYDLLQYMKYILVLIDLNVCFQFGLYIKCLC